MKLKFKILKLEDVAEQFRELYTKGDDGAYYLDAEGAVSRERLDEFRNNNVELMKQLDGFKDIDPAKYRELMDQHRKLSEKKLIDEGKVEELINQRVAQMRTDYDKQVAELNGKLTASNRQLDVLLIDNSAREIAGKLGVAPTAVDDVLLRARTIFQVQDGKPVAMKDGQMVYGKDGQNSITIGDWLGGLKESAPHLFQPSQGSGAANRPGTGGTNAPKSAAGKIAEGLRVGSSILQ